MKSEWPKLELAEVDRSRNWPKSNVDVNTSWQREPGRKWAGDSLESASASGVEAHRSQVSWTARTDGCYDWYHHRRNCLGRRLPDAERWDQTGWLDHKGVQWDGVPEPEVDVARRSRSRAKRTKVAKTTSEIRQIRPRDETHQGRAREKRVRLDEPS